MQGSPSIRLSTYIDDLQASGRYVFTLNELEQCLGGTASSRRSATRRLRKKGRLVQSKQGLLVIVPTEYLHVGAPPGSWFVDDLMHYLKRPYYVGLLSAASLYGASHQQPQLYQIVTDKSIREITVGRNHIMFYRNRNLDDVAVEQHKTPTGTITVSTLEATILDVVRSMDSCGGLDGVTTVIHELAVNASPIKLAAAARKSLQTTVQRLGYLLEQLDCTNLASALDPIVALRRKRPTLLRANGQHISVKRNLRWNVIPNESFELEV